MHTPSTEATSSLTTSRTGSPRNIASDAAEGDLALRLAESEGVEAGEVERAIEKIDEGSYGYCDVTGKPINKERLKFLPWAIRSVEAASIQ